jgi:hypothetical protein
MDNFLSNENKGLVWQLLVEANAFSNIPDKRFSQAKTLYETTLVEISQLNDLNLTAKNKNVIMTMMKKLPFLQKQSVQHPLEEVKLEIDKNFESKQQDYINLIEHKPPNEINFNDNSDEPLDNTVMNNRLNQMMEMREKELNQIQKLPDKVVNKAQNKSSDKLVNSNSDETYNENLTPTQLKEKSNNEVIINHDQTSQNSELIQPTNLEEYVSKKFTQNHLIKIICFQILLLLLLLLLLHKIL